MKRILIFFLTFFTLTVYGQFRYKGVRVGGSSTQAVNIEFDNSNSGTTATDLQTTLDDILNWEWQINEITQDLTLTDNNFVNQGKRVFNVSGNSIEITIPSTITRKTTMVLQNTDIDSIINVSAGAGVTFLGNGTAPLTAGFSVDSLNVANITPLGNGLFSVVGYFKPYSTPVYDDPPLIANPNPELVVVNSAQSFRPNETNAVDWSHTGYQPINCTASSVEDLSNNYGEYVMELEAISTTWARTREGFLASGNNELTAGEVYQYAFLYRMLPNSQNSAPSDDGEFRIGTDLGTIIQEINLTATDWTLLQGEFTMPAANYLQLQAFVAHVDGTVGDRMQYKISLKLKND